MCPTWRRTFHIHHPASKQQSSDSGVFVHILSRTEVIHGRLTSPETHVHHSFARNPVTCIRRFTNNSSSLKYEYVTLALCIQEKITFFHLFSLPFFGIDVTPSSHLSLKLDSLRLARNLAMEDLRYFTLGIITAKPCMSLNLEELIYRPCKPCLRTTSLPRQGLRLSIKHYALCLAV